jgi:hypothetical protein
MSTSPLNNYRERAVQNGLFVKLHEQNHLHWRRQLAALKFNSRERMDVYRQVFLRNRSFHFIVPNGGIRPIRIFDSRTLKEMRGLAQEVQTEINTALLNPLESVEMNDWTHFGKVRCALEKRLRGSEPRAGFEEK